MQCVFLAIIPIPIIFFYNMAQHSTKPQVPSPSPLSIALATAGNNSTKPQVPSPSPLFIALATAGIIDEVVPEEGQNQILDLTTVSDPDPVPSTSSTPTPYEIFMKKKEKLEQKLSKNHMSHPLHNMSHPLHNCMRR